MQLYNSATRTREVFVPREPGKVKMYTCGPTVYHYAHIGNLRSYIMEDVLEKFLRYEGYAVTRVMNITDVGHLAGDTDTGEDKMLSGARREKRTVLEIARYYTDAFFADCAKLNIKTPDIVAPATGCISEYIAAVEKLLHKGNAYLAGGNVYFDTTTLSKYHVFADQDEDELMVGARDSVHADPHKRNKADFVLWFTKSKFQDQELKWDSPWGMGYPGWHIECSCISIKYLGEYLDIHCGGIDNAFPHHTNEIAQSEALLGHPWCNYWVHVHHLNLDSGKMSKSKGEFLTVALLEQRGYDPLAYRFFCLQSHYRKGLVFSWENLDNAAGAYRKLVARVAALDPQDATAPTPAQETVMGALRDTFSDGMGGDLNTSLGVTALYDVLKADLPDGAKLTLLDEFDRVLSLGLLTAAGAVRHSRTAPTQADPEVEALIAARAAAKQSRDFAAADSIRAQLKDMGVELKDTPQGTVWTRV